MNPQIPILDLKRETADLWPELLPAIEGVLRSAEFIMGPNVAAFESEIARDLGVKHAVAMNSGTDALVLALRALGVGPGDEVVTTPFTFFATAEAIGHVGATPVFADIDPETFNLEPADVARKITPRTKAIIPVHLYGLCADMDPILDLARRHDIKIVEDVAQAFGATYKGRMAGAMGEVGCFSFFPSKNLGAYGDGGLATTNDDAVAASLRMLRTHGARKKYHNEVLGYNSRLDEMQAAILRVKLPHVARWNDARRKVAAQYDRLLAGVPGVTTPREPTWARHVHHQYTVRIAGGERDAVQKRLAEAGIGTMVYYPFPVHKLPLYASWGVSCPLAEKAAGEVLSLPMGPYIFEKEVAEVAEQLRAAIGR